MREARGLTSMTWTRPRWTTYCTLQSPRTPSASAMRVVASTIWERTSGSSAAGYTAIEPWIQELDEHVKGGGTLADLKKRFADAGLAVPDCIGFAEWLQEPAEKERELDEIIGYHLEPDTSAERPPS